MPSNEVMEEELLRSIEEVEDRINSFRSKVRDVLAELQGEERPGRQTATR
mgnify:CR=1 FL=1